MNGSWLQLTAYCTVLSPNKKLQWFADQGWDANEIEIIRKEVVSQWETSYKPTTAAVVSNQETLLNPKTVAVAIVRIAVQLFHYWCSRTDTFILARCSVEITYIQRCHQTSHLTVLKAT